jgi:Transposase DDE domain
MHQRIGSILSLIRQDVASHLSRSFIHETCTAVDHVWRQCVLEPATIVHVFMIRILHGNTALNQLRHLTGIDLTAQAFCDARMRLPLDVFRLLLRKLVPVLRDGQQTPGLWRGHRTFAVDGSSCSMPDTPELQKEFGQSGAQRPGCGFPTAHFLALFDSATGFLLEVLTAPLRTHDMSQVARVHPGLRAGDVLVGDRGFCSFAHIALLAERGIHGVFRLHQKLKFLAPNRGRLPSLDIGKLKGQKKRARALGRVLHQLGISDHIVEWHRPQQRPEWMTAQEYALLPEVLLCRILTYDIPRGYRTRRITLVTTLLEAELYPWEELAELYHRRWRVETNFKHIKITMKMDVLRCQTVEGVLKELTMFALVYNLVRVVMVEAAHRQNVDVERISFIDALRWLATAKPQAVLRKLIENPDRQGKVEPRVRKRRPKQYPLMNEPRAILRKRLLSHAVAA